MSSQQVVSIATGVMSLIQVLTTWPYSYISLRISVVVIIRQEGANIFKLGRGYYNPLSYVYNIINLINGIEDLK